MDIGRHYIAGITSFNPGLNAIAGIGVAGAVNSSFENIATLAQGEEKATLVGALIVENY